MSYVEQIDIDQSFHNFASTLFRYKDTAKKNKLVTHQYFHTQIVFRNKAKTKKSFFFKYLSNGTSYLKCLWWLLINIKFSTKKVFCTFLTK